MENILVVQIVNIQEMGFANHVMEMGDAKIAMVKVRCNYINLTYNY